MARQHIVEHADVQPQQCPSTLHIPDRPFEITDRLPAVCTVAHVAWVLGITPSGVQKLRQAGKLREFLLPSLGDRKARYCGRRLQQWANGEFAVERSFGRQRTRVA